MWDITRRSEIALTSENPLVPVEEAPGVTVEEAPGAEPDRRLDAWLIWLVTVVAVVLPVIVLICVSSIPAGKFDFSDTNTAVDRGDFLIPVLIMQAETVRRWTRETSCTNIYWRSSRVLACVACSIIACVCFAATAISAVDPVTKASGRSLEAITYTSFFVALVFGSVAVAAKARKS